MYLLYKTLILAVRDQAEFKDLYTFLGLTSSCVCDLSVSELRFAYESDLVFGTVQDFAAHVLYQEFDEEKTRVDRRFQCLIVDEVDNLTIDQCLQKTYLSSYSKGLHYLQSLYLRIWTSVMSYQPVPASQSFILVPVYFLNVLMNLFNETESNQSSEENKDLEFVSGYLGALNQIKDHILNVDVVMEKIKQLSQMKLENQADFEEKSQKALNEHLDLFCGSQSLESKICRILSKVMEANYYALDETGNPALIMEGKNDKNLLIFQDGFIAEFFKSKDDVQVWNLATLQNRNLLIYFRILLLRESKNLLIPPMRNRKSSYQSSLPIM